MFNQRGQAFSVFELMIAAIVAVAILFVLLPIIGSITTNPGSSAVDSVKQTLDTYKGGGNGYSPAFTLDKGQSLASTDFISKGYDSHQIVLGVSSELTSAGQTFTVSDIGSSDVLGTRVNYSGSTKIKLVAAVYCQVTGELVGSVYADDPTLASADFGQQSATDNSCGASDYTPCCLVVLKRG